jgi:hypothetical protein
MTIDRLRAHWGFTRMPFSGSPDRSVGALSS